MRECAVCHKPDAPWFEQHPCTCGAAKEHEDDPSPLKHEASCRGIGHMVVQYPVRIARSELRMKGSEFFINAYYAQRGWKLMQNGIRWYRVKMMCRDCIVAEDSAQERRREYERACKAARGQDDTTYAQMLAQQ